MRGPMRKVIAYTESSGTMQLECGHIKGKRPGATHPKTSECVLCLPLEKRRERLRKS